MAERMASCQRRIISGEATTRLTVGASDCRRELTIQVTSERLRPFVRISEMKPLGNDKAINFDAYKGVWSFHLGVTIVTYCPSRRAFQRPKVISERGGRLAN